MWPFPNKIEAPSPEGEGFTRALSAEADKNRRAPKSPGGSGPSGLLKASPEGEGFRTIPESDSKNLAFEDLGI